MVKKMSDYSIPVMPKLEFNKINNETYHFNVEQGKTKSDTNSKYYDIFNIEIKINTQINIKFKMNFDDYKTVFLEKNDKNEFKKPLYPRNIQIECTCGIYSTVISKCHEIETKRNENMVYVSVVGSKVNFIKDNKSITNDEIVNVWNVLEINDITENSILKFKNKYLNDVFLKSVPIKHNSIESEDKKRTLQLLNKNSFIFYKAKYKNYNPDFLRNIKKLLYFYDLDENPIRMKIIEQEHSEKLEIVIESKFSKNPKLSSIFDDGLYNLYEFINSAYPQYIKLKKSEIDIDLLLHYYVLIKNEPYIEGTFILSSIFLEIFKNNRICPYQNESNDFENKINNRLLLMKLDTKKLFKTLHSDVYEILNQIESHLYHENFSKKDIKKVIEYYKKDYLVILIAFYRNKSIHSGEFTLNDKKLEEFIDKKWISNFKLSDSQKNITKEIKSILKTKLHGLNWFYESGQQTQTLEFIIDILLLRLLNVNCTLGNFMEFDDRTNRSVWVNSKEFVENYSINFNIKKMSKWLMLTFKSRLWKLPNSCKFYKLYIKKFQKSNFKS